MFTLTQAQDRFTARYMEFRRKAGKLFHDYSPEARDEAIANTLSLTWHNFVPMIDNGKADEHLLTCTFYFACKATRSGRKMRVKKHDHSRELFNTDCVVTGIDLDAFVSLRDNVLDVVGFHIDTEAWLDSLPETARVIATELAQGDGTNDVAKRHHVSPGAISQRRASLKASYDTFMSSE